MAEPSPLLPPLSQIGNVSLSGEKCLPRTSSRLPWSRLCTSKSRAYAQHPTTPSPPGERAPSLTRIPPKLNLDERHSIPSKHLIARPHFHPLFCCPLSLALFVDRLRPRPTHLRLLRMPRAGFSFGFPAPLPSPPFLILPSSSPGQPPLASHGATSTLAILTPAPSWCASPSRPIPPAGHRDLTPRLCSFLQSTGILFSLVATLAGLVVFHLMSRWPAGDDSTSWGQRMNKVANPAWSPPRARFALQ